jgi:hypothetical protein
LTRTSFRREQKAAERILAKFATTTPVEAMRRLRRSASRIAKIE